MIRPSGRRARPLRGRWRPLGLLACVLLAAPVHAHAVPRAVPAVRGDLAGVTSITWRGTAGFLLNVPKRVDLPAADGPRLYVRGGTYAFVRLVADGLCDPRLPRYCFAHQVSYTRDIGAHFYRGQPPGFARDAHLGNPPGLERGTWQLYLFTDGVATLELRPSRLSGQRSYDARGHVDGGVRPLPTSCPTAGCDADGYAGGRYVFGGASRSVGRLGYVESLAYSIDRTSYPVPGVGVPVVQPHPVHVCTYSGGHAHPLGCDVPGTRQETLVYDTDDAVNEVVLAAFGQSGLMARIFSTDVTGDAYAGYRAGYVTDVPTDSVTAGYGIWFAYGIR